MTKTKTVRKKLHLIMDFHIKSVMILKSTTIKHSISSSHLESIPSKTLLLERDKEKVVHAKQEVSQYKSKEMRSLFGAESVDIMERNVDRNYSGLIKGKNKKVSSSQAALSGKKLNFKAQKQLNEDRDRKSYGEDQDYALDPTIDLANSYPKDKSVKLDKKTILFGETGTKSGVGNDGEFKISTLFDNKSDPLPLVYRNGTAESSTALTAPAPIVINEQWVCCDKCENWRLLPYGMNPEFQIYFPKNGGVACRVGCKFIHFIHFLQVLLYVLFDIRL